MLKIVNFKFLLIYSLLSYLFIGVSTFKVLSQFRGFDSFIKKKKTKAGRFIYYSFFDF